jgi:hypothetical protein
MADESPTRRIGIPASSKTRSSQIVISGQHRPPIASALGFKKIENGDLAFRWAWESVVE